MSTKFMPPIFLTLLDYKVLLKNAVSVFSMKYKLL